ncbi:MAG: glutamate-5-semialdehyde dehydrogenase [Oscillospiraceae bacterium]|jgi:glutamate-5-semialdehyde dehydrogenase|nr:glutamate-5-semialdehyde dehydrogenase [Oscillospiraceae bacterium]
MSYIKDLGERAVSAKAKLSAAPASKRDSAILKAAELLVENADNILLENTKDIAAAIQRGIKDAFIERLTLSDSRIAAIADGLRKITALPDPLGEVIGGGNLPNGLSVVKKRVPLGVIGIIFESRPNVAADAAGLCLKSGNTVILRGGSDAIHSNRVITNLFREACIMSGLPADSVILVEDTSRDAATALMRLNGYVDVLIPRGGAGLIKSVVENATVPVIETGAGNCHVYVDEYADIAKAVSITDNAKKQRPSVCNSIESLLVHTNIASTFLPALASVWGDSVEIYGDPETAAIIHTTRPVTDEDYYTEYNENKIAVRIVPDIKTAIAHIEKYGTHHSDAIITENFRNATEFTEQVQSAAVYVNASTRFTDGYEFGLGAEIGISTQKLHARGPMGLKELTTYKYIVTGDGQIRE